MTKLGHIIQLFRRDEDGTALVEMALVAPFVLLLSAGVFEFSNILNTRLLLGAGVEDAARYMARCSGDWDTCKGLAQKLAAYGAVDGTSARVTGWLPAQVTITPTSTAAVDTTTTPPTEIYLSSKSTVDVVTVSTSYTYPDLGFWSYLGFGDITLSVAHQERVFGW